MKGEVVNKPYKSRWIGGMYIFLTVLIALVYIFVSLFGELRQVSCFLEAVFSIIMIFAFSLILITTVSFYTTGYRIKDGVLTSWSPFASINLKLRDIKKVEKTMVPLHFRVGASLYCGIFYVPCFGWIKSIITNLRDAILITAKDGEHYMITPSNPQRFMKELKSLKT